MSNIRQLILNADLNGLREALTKDKSLANKGLPYDEKNRVLAHPLHRIADGVFVNAYSDEQAIDIAKIFVEFGSDVNGGDVADQKDTPLIAATSLSAEKLALYYLDNGADIHHAGTHGGTAIHWAAWMGHDKLVERLIEMGADLDKRCVEYHSTPLMWAVNGYGFDNGGNRYHQVDCAKMMIAAGGDKATTDADRKKMMEFIAPDDVAMRSILS